MGVLGAFCGLPEITSHLLHGERRACRAIPADARWDHRAASQPGGWIWCGERACHQIPLGLTGMFWRPVIEYAEVQPDGFTELATAAYAKTVYAVGARALEGRRTLLQ